jgi:hypothetical protein
MSTALHPSPTPAAVPGHASAAEEMRLLRQVAARSPRRSIPSTTAMPHTCAASCGAVPPPVCYSTHWFLNPKEESSHAVAISPERHRAPGR